MNEEAEECKCPPPGLPMYMATFADLMALLMCFFVLLLAFSEMDVLKFKQIAGSMKFAFGVQNKIEVDDIPKGTSVIALEFRPGRPEPTPIETLQQQTMEITQQVIEFQAGDEDSAGGRKEQRDDMTGGESASNAEDSSDTEAAQQASQEQTNQQVKKLAEQLEQQILDGAIELESLGQQIIIRIRENGSFASGSSFLQPRFKPIVQRIGQLLNDVPGEITVTGHTDDIQVSNELHSNNWDLSAQRAVSVATEMVKAQGFDRMRLVVVGHADTKPLVANDSNANRRQNRRVEISIMQGKAKESNPVSLEGETN
ncbi:flagellar motor protein MotB [Rheinheimera salexigens]|uniref:Flagellar motor protein MotB n=1 Tax=Rheinheimera salexigens TaxID=1628148 RepID=A0A1E7Q5I1_9GAMM|nr:flagellar motor protein MotB [Rheinheimera salexigens]OEY69318.1 flagellar motor protein MotB [Rheinheimera salexigens]